MSRLNGLTKKEKKILIDFIKESVEDEMPQEFAAAVNLLQEGYMTYMTANTSFFEYGSFLVVAHYPGDNEYGVIYELNDDDTVKREVASIVDGDIEDCKVFKN